MKGLFFVIIASVWFLVSCNDTDSSDTKMVAKDSVVSTVAADSVNMPSSPQAISITTIIDSLRKIPFVAETNRYIDSFSNHNHGIAFLIDTVSAQELHFNAGYNGEQRFETYYLFKVNPHNFDIRIAEPISGDYLTLAEYQKANPQ